jgi:hypothetical protein
MTLALKNGAVIVKDGKLAEDCGCCGDWYCDLDPTMNPDIPCCSTQALSMTISCTASPQLSSTRFGETVSNALKARFPVAISRTVTLQKSGSKYSFTSGFNYFGTGESRFGAVVTISKDVCLCTIKVEQLYFNWKWDMQAAEFSAGDPAREPTGFQYGDLIFQTAGQFNNRLNMSAIFDVGQEPCFATKTFRTEDQTIPGFGSATGTIAISPA